MSNVDLTATSYCPSEPYSAFSSNAQGTSFRAAESDRTVIPPKPNTGGVIIGRGMLSEIRSDIQKTILPSWIGRVPNDFGSASAGTLSADEWRTACTVNLVTSLVRLWGGDSDSAERRMLDNFLELVTAVKVATQRTITDEDIVKYESHMKRYLEGYIELYSDTHGHHLLHPYHHISLHIGKFLRSFGPVHSWRCFAFERFNGRLQKIPTNGKEGK